ncbi:MAG: TolC family protein [Chitinophagia bacterium]|nr:TolC family protein [Chitinophagia bacterium]
MRLCAIWVPLRMIFMGEYAAKPLTEAYHMGKSLVLCALLLFSPFALFAQAATEHILHEGDSTYPAVTLEYCIDCALRAHPAMHQAFLDEEIARTNKAIAFSSWLPQVTLAANLQHYLELPTSFLRVNDVLTPIRTGVNNTSNPQLNATQTIFSNDALLANRTAHLYMRLQEEQTDINRRDVITRVIKAYYDVLLSTEKVNVYRQDTQRLRRNQADAYHRYLSGIADKVDYKQASIALNNSLTQLNGALENVQAAYAALRQCIGISADSPFRVVYDTGQILQQAEADTNASLHVERLPEYRQLQIAKQIQKATTSYYKTGFLPNLSAFYTYNNQYQNNNFNDLYKRAYPNSFLGLQLNVPLFTGFRRLENIHKSQLQEQRADADVYNLILSLYTQYRQALAAYKTNLYSYRIQAENRTMAREVYDIVKLQYNEGIKAYVEVTIAETDLQTSEINYQDALFELLKSRADLERAIGNILLP